jgi:O-acetylserine/cysteine efflux transporter
MLVSFATEGGVEAFRAVANASWVAWASLAFLAWVATLFGFSAWNRLLHRYPAALISPFALLIPVSGLASGALLLGERLTALQIAGVLLVFAGLAVNVYGPALWARLRMTSRAS